MNRANGSATQGKIRFRRASGALTLENTNQFVEYVQEREKIRRLDTLRSCVEYSGVSDYQHTAGQSNKIPFSSSADLLELAEGDDVAICEVVPDNEILLPPPGKAWSRVRSNIVPPKTCKEKFFVPYLGEEEEDIKASSQLADDLMDDDSDDGKAESNRYNDAEDGNFCPENAFNRTPFASCIPQSLKEQGDDSDAELERIEENRFSESSTRKWDRIFKRLTIFAYICEHGPEKFKDTVSLLGRALKLREDTVHRYFSNACWRAYQWARENHQDNVNSKHRAHLIDLIRNETRTPTSEILASDSVHYFFCRQCKEYDCWVHTEQEGRDFTPSQIPFDNTRKDTMSAIGSKKLEESCLFRGTNKCWYSATKANTSGVSPTTNGIFGDHGNTVDNPGDNSNGRNGLQNDTCNANLFCSDEAARDMLLLFRSIFGDDFCRLAESLNLTCIYKTSCLEVGTFVKSNLPPVQTTANVRPKKKKIGKKITKKSSRSVVHKPSNEGDLAKPDYNPCDHEGPCTIENCSCIQNSLHCEKYCRCSSPRVNGASTHEADWCPNAYFGCSCKGGCKTKQCDCFGNDRECDPDFCSCLNSTNKDGTQCTTGAKCTNAGLRSNNVVSLVCGHSSVHGWGVYARHPIAKGTLIGQYTGEFLLNEDGERRGRVYDQKNSSYLFLTTVRLNVDSSHVGNKLRFINHSSHANCIPRLRRVDGTVLVGMYALRDIQAFEELLFNYNYDSETGPEFARQFRQTSNQKRRRIERSSHSARNGDDSGAD